MEILLIIMLAPLALGIGLGLLQLIGNIIVALSESYFVLPCVLVLMFVATIFLGVNAGVR